MNESNQPVIVGNAQSALYELDRVEIGFFQLLLNQGLPAQRKRDADTNTTPRIELDLEAEQIQNYRRIQPGVPQTQFLYEVAWDYKLTCVVVTNREQNGDNHSPLVGLMRWNMQMATIAQTWTPAVCSTHKIVSSKEEGAQADVWNEGGLDTSTLTFTGIFAIPENRW